MVRSRDAGAFTGSTLRYDLLAIDPDTFEAAAFWNDAFSDDSLADLVARLPSTGGAALPVILSNGGDYDPSSIDLSDKAVPIEIVGRATSFPGTSTSDRPLLVVDRDALAEHFTDIPDPLNTPMASAEFWVAGPTDEILASLADIGATPYSVLTADEVEDIPFIDAAIQTFLMLDVLGDRGDGAAGRRRDDLPPSPAALPRGGDRTLCAAWDKRMARCAAPWCWSSERS